MSTHYSPPPRNQTTGPSRGTSIPLWGVLLASVVSAVIGGAIAASIVSSGAADVEALQPQVDGLSVGVGDLSSRVADLETRLVFLSGSDQRIAELERRADQFAADLDDLSGQVGSSGSLSFFARISGDRVDAPFGCSGRPAVWSGFGGTLRC